MTNQPSQMIAIPLGLLEQVERGNVLLFIGERIVRDAHGQVTIDQLTRQLITQCKANCPEEYSFAEAAQLFEDGMGRHALVQTVRDFFQQSGDEPQRVHRLIASLTDCKVLVTTCFDRRLERAFAEAGRPLHVIVGGIEVAFQDDQKARLYKLRGSVERVESLILAEEDYERFFEEHASISVVLKAYLASMTILFIGYDLADPQFRQLYRRVTSLLDNYARRSYAFGELPTQRVAHWCKRHGIEVVETLASTFLEALIAQLDARERRDPPAASSRPPVEEATTPLPERPYKLLAHYEPTDTAIFFGRTQESQQLTSLIHAHRLVLLYGASGTGKTSLLLAGVLPRLARAQPPYEVLYVRGRTDPALAIHKAIRRRTPDADLPQDGPLVDFLHAATDALEHPLVIFLDQFEDFFLQSNDPQQRQAFIAELGDLYDARDVPVKIVLSLREDWLASMSEVEKRIPEIYRIKMRVLPLSRQQASQVITEPVKQLGIHYDPVLVDRLLDDLAEAMAEETRERESTSVMPPQLQLVCSALYERARDRHQPWIAMAEYEAVGGAGGILARYIAEALQEHPGEERAVAKAILVTLVTAGATRAWASLHDITARIGADRQMVEKVLARLVRQRLVRRLDDEQSYELTHDVLAATIADWISNEDRQLKQIQELLQRGLTDWQQDHAVLPSLGKFQRIDALQDRLRLTDAEAALLLRTAVLYNKEVPYWLEQVESPDRQVEILLEMVQHDADSARLHAATYLAGFPQEPVAVALAGVALTDLNPAVRDAAATSLGQMGGRAGLEHLIDHALDGEDLQRARAVRALALIRDAVPQQSVPIPASLQRSVYRELATLRFRRAWPWIRQVTAAGAVGGAIGFGLGVTPIEILNEITVFQRLVLRDAPFVATFTALFGLIAGTGTGFGYSAGRALLKENPNLGRTVGGTLLGGLGFAIALFPLAMAAGTGLVAGLAGGGLFGALFGFGMSAPTLVNQKRPAQLAGGAAGGALGIILFTLQYAPEVLPYEAYTSILILAGGLLGLIMAFSIGWVEARWPVGEREESYAVLPEQPGSRGKIQAW